MNGNARKKQKGPVKTALVSSFIFIIIFWIVLILEYISPFDFCIFGIIPRTLRGMAGIITAPFIHADFEHLLMNTVPFCSLSFLLFLFYGKRSAAIFILLWITGGIITWIIGRPACHIGASIVIYALASFLIFGGILSRKPVLLLASAIVLLLYSGLVWGIFPTEGRISWEGHLAGAISGIICAFKYRKSLRNPGKPVKKNY